MLLEDSVLCIIQSRASFLADPKSTGAASINILEAPCKSFIWWSLPLWQFERQCCAFSSTIRNKVFTQKGNITFWQLLLWPFLHLTLLLQRCSWRLISWHRHCAINFQSYWSSCMWLIPIRLSLGVAWGIYSQAFTCFFFSLFLFSYFFVSFRKQYRGGIQSSSARAGLGGVSIWQFLYILIHVSAAR